MNIYHFIKQLDELLSPEGLVMADANDDGLAGLEDNSAAWYGAGEDGEIAVVTVNRSSYVVALYDADGQEISRSSWPRTVDIEVVYASIVGDI